MGTLTKHWPSALLLAAVSSTASPLLPRQTDDGNNADLFACPGYTASNVQKSSTGITADLTLAGEPCNTYGQDLKDLTLTVEYQTGEHWVKPGSRYGQVC